MKIEWVNGDGGLKKSNGNDRYNSQKKEKIQMKRSPYLFERISIDQRNQRKRRRNMG